MSEAKGADVDRLTELLKRLETTPDVVRLSSFKPEILGDCTVGDLRQSLSQEAVRDEALEEAAKVCEREAEAHRSFGNHAMRTPAGRQGAIAQEVAARNCSTLIRALKREPNAAGESNGQ